MRARARTPLVRAEESDLTRAQVTLPTDALPAPRPKLRIAAITTAYFKYSHADDIITKFIEGYSILGRTHQPPASVVSLAIQQFPASDIGRGLAARYGIPIFDTPAAALGWAARTALWPWTA